MVIYCQHQDTLKAICRGISEACRDCSINQTFCSHIVPLCIRRCRGGSSDMFIVLQSLLTNHSRNMKLFHENNGMKIFTRESLQHSFCLQLLNTVVENTTNENHHVVVSESSHIFEHLRYFLHKYGASNLIGQWVSIILFSYQKVLRKFGKENNNINGIDGSIRKPMAKESHPSRHVVCNNKQNDTNELFQKIQNKTIGAKFIDIINGSCTTLVKSYTSFKNIFRNKEPSTCKDVSTSTTAVSTFCSNSFTNYMRKRDAISNYFNEKENETQLKREFSGEDNLSSCNTCNDTIALKQKMTNDAKLQQTVKRLKFGINMYGCDFKKISRTMWPNEHYMTPSVLYNLYRKLIIK
ncbi:uncharacterized protein LOC125069192 [Vanessa atalanta]|uniref:uncharacterized protein LOC125069192 n=1 Tax=Vanessa atalanta TaxID=42275 RepID=UPI001FCE2762|nr:uncharacterized protein LOC125069192 [Vanessa atalanta]